jgi:hypothetical protein
MRYSGRFLAVVILAISCPSGCHLIFPYKSGNAPPNFNGTFRGPIQADFPTGTAILGDTLEITLKQEKAKAPAGSTQNSSPLIEGDGTSFTKSGQILKKFLIVGNVLESSSDVADLKLTEFQTHKETTARATLNAAKDQIDFVVNWPSGLKAKATLKKMKSK